MNPGSPQFSGTGGEVHEATAVNMQNHRATQQLCKHHMNARVVEGKPAAGVNPNWRRSAYREMANVPREVM
jgi:hypothetical protein